MVFGLPYIKGHYMTPLQSLLLSCMTDNCNIYTPGKCNTGTRIPPGYHQDSQHSLGSRQDRSPAKLAGFTQGWDLLLGKIPVVYLSKNPAEKSVCTHRDPSERKNLLHVTHDNTAVLPGSKILGVNSW